MEKYFGVDYKVGEVVSLRNEPGYRVKYLGMKNYSITRPAHAFEVVDACNSYVRYRRNKKFLMFFVKPYCYKVKEECND